MYPPGKRLHNYGKSPCFFMGNLTISMALFHNYISLPTLNGPFIHCKVCRSHPLFRLGHFQSTFAILT